MQRQEWEKKCKDTHITNRLLARLEANSCERYNTMEYNIYVAEWMSLKQLPHAAPPELVQKTVYSKLEQELKELKLQGQAQGQ